MTDSFRNIAVTCSVFLWLGGCASIKVPDLDFLKIPEFQHEAENIGTYPEAADAPDRPTDLRTDKQWDKALGKLIDIRDGFVAPNDGAPVLTEQQINDKIRALSMEVEAYKADDPESLSK